jgi:hypothetical protein
MICHSVRLKFDNSIVLYGLWGGRVGVDVLIIGHFYLVVEIVIKIESELIRCLGSLILSNPKQATPYL